VQWQNRAHFFAISAMMMRRILVDFARSRPAEKRNGGAFQLPLDEAAAVPAQRAGDLIALDEALSDLAKFDERKSRIVELKFFGGLTVEETAEVLKVSPITVMREWNKAKAWLYRSLEQQTRDGA
jgi:RNA polymerase sigma-70 factor (ECF subfamily)